MATAPPSVVLRRRPTSCSSVAAPVQLGRGPRLRAGLPATAFLCWPPSSSATTPQPPTSTGDGQARPGSQIWLHLLPSSVAGLLSLLRSVHTDSSRQCMLPAADPGPQSSPARLPCASRGGSGPATAALVQLGCASICSSILSLWTLATAASGRNPPPLFTLLHGREPMSTPLPPNNPPGRHLHPQPAMVINSEPPRPPTVTRSKRDVRSVCIIGRPRLPLHWLRTVTVSSARFQQQGPGERLSLTTVASWRQRLAVRQTIFVYFFILLLLIWVNSVSNEVC
ncbi:hypothetical protein VPH35_038421 [Triticum aestivum]